MSTDIKTALERNVKAVALRPSVGPLSFSELVQTLVKRLREANARLATRSAEE